MIPKHQIRADYDRDTIVVYQAYRPAIAEAALGAAVLTAPRPGQGADQWRHQLEQSPVRVQWDPERSLRGAKLDYRSGGPSPGDVLTTGPGPSKLSSKASLLKSKHESSAQIRK